jgi:L-lactate dehydrogenase complex protein LldG
MLTGIVHHASDADAAARAVLDVCRRHAASRVLAWDERWCGVAGLDAALARAGIDADRGWLPADPATRLARLAVLDTILVGVTGAAGAIAESGTIAVLAGPGRARSASLLPPVHVAIVPVSRLYADLPSFLASHPDVAEQGSNLVLITGPSRTADIEMTLTRGVHGPGEVHVVLQH